MKINILLNVLIFISLIGFSTSIIGGNNVNIKQFPYLVSVRLDDKHICGGVIIDESTILTAAHCIDRDKCVLQYSIRAGTTNHNAGEEFLVVDIITHEQYNKAKNHDSDIAILKLFGNLRFTSNIQLIPLQDPNKEIQPDAICQVSGWGRTEKEMNSKNLKATNVSIISYEECRKYFTISLTPNMICASTSKCSRFSLILQQVFEGDSGGPLVCDGKLVGIVSFGADCRSPDCPCIYTKVHVLHDWIMENKNSEPKNYCAKRKNNSRKEPQVKYNFNREITSP